MVAMKHPSRCGNVLLAAVALLSCTVRLGGQAPAVKPSPNLAGIAHVALRVHDLDASVAFYEKLGFVKAFALSRDGAVYEAFIKINDRQFIELYPATTKDPQVGFLHICFEGNDLPSVHDYYVAQGLAPKDVRTAGAGNLLFTMPGPETPSGPQNMEYTQYMPGSMHSKDFGQHLGAQRIASKLIAVDIAFNDPAAAASFYAEKIAFIPLKRSTRDANPAYSLPGAPEQAIRIATTALGFKTRITLAAPAAQAATALKQRNVPFKRSRGTITLTDPDGNEVDFR